MISQVLLQLGLCHSICANGSLDDYPQFRVFRLTAFTSYEERCSQAQSPQAAERKTPTNQAKPTSSGARNSYF